jgi:putative transposase
VAVILDLYSRRVVGWAAASHMRTELVLDALKAAVRDRRPPAGLIHHSDRASQYASAEYRGFLRRHQIQCSMSRKGDCWDNAVAESFFSTLKTELFQRGMPPTPRAATEAIADYIENFYNPIRKHSFVGYVSPIEFEMGVAKLAAIL